MSIFQKPPVQSLSEWLEIATRKLTNASKERIRLEIQAHFAEAVEARREDGLSESDAQTRALSELGDPKAAARRFRKQHLTEREAKRLKQVDKAGRSVWFLLLNFSLFWLFTSGPILRRIYLDNRWPYLTLQVVFLIIIPAAGFVIARFSKVKPNRHLLWMEALEGLGPSWFLYLVFVSARPSCSVFWCIVVFLPRLPRLLDSLHIWMKVGRLGTISTHAPPTSKAGAS